MTSEYTKQWQEDRQLAIDIETMPNMEVVHLLPEPKISAALKDPAKIELAKIEARNEQLSKMALSPLTGKIASIGYYANNSEAFTCYDEKEMLQDFWEITRGKQLLTFNGKGFDIPFIFKRGMILGLKWATIKEMKAYCDRYKSENIHIDIMAEFCDYNKYESMDNLARFILGEQKIEFDVTAIPELIKTAEGKELLKKYNLKDCELTWKLAKRMGY